MPDRRGLRRPPRVLLPEGLRRFQASPLGLLLLSFHDQRREISRCAKHVADFIQIEKEDLLSVLDDTVAHEARAECSRGPADVGVIAAVEPVVVLLGQWTGPARGREDLFEAREIAGSVR